MLKINAIHKCFDNNIVLNAVTLAVKSSSILGIAGPSGSGKSTLLRCIQKLEKIDCGTIECDCSTGFMFQDFQLFPHMTVLQNMVYAPLVCAPLVCAPMNSNKINNNKIHTSIEKQAIALLETLKIADKACQYPCRLSGGEKQRVALARSLMMHPDLLLCDEPTSGLDVATIVDIVALLQSVREMGVAMIIVSHDLDFLTKIADRIVILKKGEVVVDALICTLKNPVSYLKNYY
jgi:polar amino acid transport system ATP-binding protein